MNRKYKFHEKEGAYLISFATIFWIDVYILILPIHQNPVESGFVMEPCEWKYVGLEIIAMIIRRSWK